MAVIISISIQDCSNFVAGSMLRSSNRYKALDETGVFGSACRHEFPAKFLDMKHGERYYYYTCIVCHFNALCSLLA